MARSIEFARARIERLMLERGEVCCQIDVVRCEAPAVRDFMAYVYTLEGRYFPVLIEMSDDEAEPPDSGAWEHALWPQLTTDWVN